VQLSPLSVGGLGESVALEQRGEQSLRVRRDGRRFVWAIDPWSRLSQQQVVRSPEFGLAGSERTWMLSYTRDKSGFHLTCVGET
jgi:hypothetical protein